MRLLLVYGTGHGQTAKIARHIAQTFTNRGNDVEVVDGRSISADLDLARYGGVIVGASVNADHFQDYIVDFVKRHRAELQRMPSAFFSVSMREAEPDPARRARAMLPIQRFMDETDWHPDKIASVAGSMKYLRYRWLMRLIWRRIPLPNVRSAARPNNDPETDAYEYTDWDAVSKFAEDFATQVRAAERAAVPA